MYWVGTVEGIVPVTTRVISGLIWACEAARPEGIGRSRSRGAKAQGIQYESAAAKALPNARHGQWWRFADRGGLGVCQTDLLLIARNAAMVLECKYTWDPRAWGQLENLYIPVVSLALRRPVFGAMMCKVLRPESRYESVVCETLKEALEVARTGRRAVVHWTGLGGRDGHSIHPASCPLPSDSSPRPA